MLDAKDVVLKARNYLGEVMPDFAALDPKVDEMVVMQDRPVWKITFYAYSGEDTGKAASIADIVRRNRIEKEVLIGANDGSLIAVSNPQPSF